MRIERTSSSQCGGSIQRRGFQERESGLRSYARRLQPSKVRSNVCCTSVKAPNLQSPFLLPEYPEDAAEMAVDGNEGYSRLPSAEKLDPQRYRGSFGGLPKHHLAILHS